MPWLQAHSFWDPHDPFLKPAPAQKGLLLKVFNNGHQIKEFLLQLGNISDISEYYLFTLVNNWIYRMSDRLSAPDELEGIISVTYCIA